MTDLIDRQAAIDAIMRNMYIEPYRECNVDLVERDYNKVREKDIEALKELPSAQPDADAIHLQKEQAYMQGWEDGRASIRCKECKHFHYDMPYVIQGVPVLGHEVCDAWGDGCKTDENGYCFLAERRTDEHSG